MRKTGIVLIEFTDCRSSAAAKTYYQPSRADYYTKGDEQKIVWGGKGAIKLGLTGLVLAEEFNRLVDNRHPEHGGQLTPKNAEKRKVGCDITFHCPKSVSVIRGLIGSEAVDQAIESAIHEVMTEMEKESQTRVRKGNKDEVRVTGNLVWADVTHRTSRPVDGFPDPLDHHHVFAFNATWDAEENCWKAMDLGAIRRDATYWEALYSSKLAARMRDLGFGISATKDCGWTISGISPGVLAKLSRRTAEVEARAEVEGDITAAQKAALGAITRTKKGPNLSGGELRDKWRSLLSNQERTELEDVCQQAAIGRLRPLRASERADFARQAVEDATLKLEATASAWRERQFLAHALHLSYGCCSLDEIHAAARASSIVRVNIEGDVWCTTTKVMAEERAILGFVAENRGTCRPLITKIPVGSLDGLSEEQAAAVHLIATSQDRVIGVHGRAGTGKTTLMKPTAELIRLSGINLVTVAPTTRARDNLKKDGFAAHTLQKLLRSSVLQSSLRDAVVWVDESGLLGTRDLRALFDLAEEHNCRVILGGDIAQHNSVGRGDALRLLLQHGGLQCADVRSIRRQRGDVYRQAVQDLSDGKSAPDLAVRGLRSLDDSGWIHELDDSERHSKLAADFLRSLQDGKSALVIAPTHAEISAVTEEIRSTLLKSGGLGAKSHPMYRLTNCNWTEVDRKLPANYTRRHVIEFTADAAGFKRGQRALVTDVREDRVRIATTCGKFGDLPLTEAAKFNVFESDAFELRIGDRVRITANMVSADKKHILPNGAIYTVAKVTDGGSIILDNGAKIDAGWGHLTLGWACTSIAAQGSTVDHVFVSQSAASGRAASLEQLYVSVSRGRDAVSIYTDSKAALYAAARRSSERLLATELMGMAGPAEQSRLSTLEHFQRWTSARALVPTQKVEPPSGAVKPAQPQFISPAPIPEKSSTTTVKVGVPLDI